MATISHYFLKRHLFSLIKPYSKAGLHATGVVFRDYLPLYIAAMTDDWAAATNLFQEQGINMISNTIISSELETALHVAVLTGANNFVNKLLEIMPLDALALEDSSGYTALHNAAIVGNTEAATALVEKNRDLLRILSNKDRLAVQVAAINCQEETLIYLIEEHEKDEFIFEDQRGLKLLIAIISAEFVGEYLSIFNSSVFSLVTIKENTPFGYYFTYACMSEIALYLVKKYPKLALLEDDEDGNSALSTIAVTDTLFAMTDTFTRWENFIYHRKYNIPTIYVF